MRYAQINVNGVCIADSYLSGEIEAEDMILLTEEEASPLGKKYVNGMWQEVERRKVEVPETDTEMLMQCLTDIELENIEAQQERQMLAQQISDLELAILEK